MNKSVYCEPFCIEKGRNFEVHRVEYAENDPYHCFMHFHEVHEFIIFEQIEGQYFYSQGESELKDFDIVFTPALETHNFNCSKRQKSWFIVQFMPHVLNGEEMAKANAFFQHGLHLRLPQSRLSEIQQQVTWLLESYQQDPFSARSLVLLRLLILTIGEYAKPALGNTSQPITHSPLYEKMLPVIKGTKEQYPIPVDDFEFNILHAKATKQEQYVRSAEILFCVDNDIVVESQGKVVALAPGESVFVPCSAEMYTYEGEGRLARAYN